MAPPCWNAEQEEKEHCSILRTVLPPVHLIAQPTSVDAVHEFHWQEVKEVDVVTERNEEYVGVEWVQLDTEVPETRQDVYSFGVFENRDE